MCETTKISNEPLDLASGRHFNDSAIRDYALGCSVAIKGGKFTRVSQEFIDEIHSDIEAMIREIRNKYPVTVHAPVSCTLTFTTGALLGRVQEAINGAITRLIQRKVQQQPSCGKTLSRTR